MGYYSDIYRNCQAILDRHRKPEHEPVLKRAGFASKAQLKAALAKQGCRHPAEPTPKSKYPTPVKRLDWDKFHAVLDQFLSEGKEIVTPDDIARAYFADGIEWGDRDKVRSRRPKVNGWIDRSGRMEKIAHGQYRVHPRGQLKP